MADQQDASTLTDEELAQQQYELLRARYMNMPTPWDQLSPARQEYFRAWVRQARQHGILPEYKGDRYV